MRAYHVIKWTAAVLACVNWVLPLGELAGAPPLLPLKSTAAYPASGVVDLALGANGQLLGQVVDAQGRPLPQTAVIARRAAGGESHQATTDQEGRFRLEGMASGVLLISTENTATICRCWTADAAPPAAKNQLLLVANDSISRGQKPLGELLSNPILIGLIIAAAIAIPIAVHNSKKSAS